MIQNTFPSPAAKDSDVECPTVGRNPAWVPPNCDRMYLGIHLGPYRALATLHLSIPRSTSFKNGAPREDAAANAAGERAMFSLLEGPKVDMRGLAVNIFGDVGFAAFNGHFTGIVNGSRPISGSRRQATMVFISSGDEWKLVHEHFSPLATSQPD